MPGCPPLSNICCVADGALCPSLPMQRTVAIHETRSCQKSGTQTESCHFLRTVPFTRVRDGGPKGQDAKRLGARQPAPAPAGRRPCQAPPLNQKGTHPHPPALGRRDPMGTIAPLRGGSSEPCTSKRLLTGGRFCRFLQQPAQLRPTSRGQSSPTSYAQLWA